MVNFMNEFWRLEETKEFKNQNSNLVVAFVFALMLKMMVNGLIAWQRTYPNPDL